MGDAMRTQFLGLSVAAILAACSTTPTPASGATGSSNGLGGGADSISQAAADVVAICSGGAEISRSVRAELTAELTNILRGQGSIDTDAAVTSAVRGIVYREQDLTNANVLESQRIYTGCITANLPEVR